MINLMIRIKFFTNFCTDSVIYDAVTSIFLDKENTYKHLKIVKDNSYTHAVLINTPMPNLTIPKENVLGLAHEPIPFLGLTQKFVEYAQKHISQYNMGNKIPYSPFVSHFGFLSHKPERQNYLKGITPEKKGKMAIWCSFKTHAPGHKYRHQLIQRVLEEKLDIDIWGNGSHIYKGDNVKGRFQSEPYKDYEYCISIENYVTDDYISEKLLNCLCFNTIPVYLGAKNVNKYFGDCCFKLTGEIDKDTTIIKEILENSPKKDLSYAREQLFEKDCYLPEYLANYWKN